jgi:uncharacterized membrane protein
MPLVYYLSTVNVLFILAKISIIGDNMAKLTFSIEIEAPVVEVFKFIADGVNAPKWHPLIRYAERIENTKLGVGSLVRYDVKVGPLRLVWVTRAVEFEWNRMFKDVLVRVEEGPLKEYVLSGYFESRNNSTIVRMELYYKLSWGILGELLDKLIISRRVEKHMLEGLQKAKRYLESLQKGELE